MTAPVRVDEPSTGEDELIARPWNVVVWNDPVNLMDYVVWVFRKMFGFPIEEATRLMLMVHNEGRAIVQTASRERAEVSVFRLHHYGLWATLERS